MESRTVLLVSVLASSFRASWGDHKFCVLVKYVFGSKEIALILN